MNSTNDNHQLDTILLIGNGFDIACNYATRYKDFIEGKRFCSLVDDGNDLCTYIQNVANIQKWVDLETELYNYSIKVSKENGNNAKATSKFREDFFELSKALQDYLTSVTSSISGNSIANEQVKEILKRWEGYNNIIGSVCFNYTQFFFINYWHNKYGDRTKPNIPVHGSVAPDMTINDNTIVLGIDEAMKVDSSHSFLYKSSNPKYNIRGISSIIKSAQKYIVFGCSLGKTDEWYYKQLFSQKGKTFEIYHYGLDERFNIINQITLFCGSFSDFSSQNKLILLDCSDLEKLAKKLETNYTQ